VCRTEVDYQNADHPWVRRTDETYSAQGQLLEQRHLNPDGSAWSMILRYGENGQLVEKQIFGAEPAANQLFSYRYDPLGRLERVILRDPQEFERVCESVQYAADGTKTRTEYPTPLSETQRRQTGVCVEAMLHVSLDAVAIMTIADASDRPIRKVLYDADDRVIRRVGFRYCESGRLLEEGELVGGRIRDDFRNVYRYDTAGRQVEVDRHWGDFGGSRRTFTYNERGDTLQESIQPRAGLAELGPDPETRTLQFAYVYDDPGNWIERTTQTILATGDRRLTTVERRELIYY
jgi:hypothetical protein